MPCSTMTSWGIGVGERAGAVVSVAVGVWVGGGGSVLCAAGPAVGVSVGLVVGASVGGVVAVGAEVDLSARVVGVSGGAAGVPQAASTSGTRSRPTSSQVVGYRIFSAIFSPLRALYGQSSDTFSPIDCRLALGSCASSPYLHVPGCGNDRETVRYDREKRAESAPVHPASAGWCPSSRRPRSHP